MKPDNKLNLFDYVSTLSKEICSLYENTQTCRNDLVGFMQANQWFMLSFEVNNGNPFLCKCDIDKIKDSLILWLSAYKKSGSEKTKLLLNNFCSTYPITCKLLEDFLKVTDCNNETAYKLLDYLFYEIKKEIVDFSEYEIEELMRKMQTEATKAVIDLFAEFLQTSKHDGKPISVWKYTVESRERDKALIGAYSVNDFSVMAYLVFNDDMIAENDLVKKALDSRIYAELWLYVAMHFICALRKSDIKRLPAPELKCDIKEKIIKKTVKTSELVSLAEELIIRLNLKPMKPSKTSSHTNIPYLKIFIPESLKETFGLMIALVLMHHQGEKSCYMFGEDNPLTWKLLQMKKFFGDNFVKALGYKNFSNLRANKAYLQGIEMIADSTETEERVKGYMLAALARSHKGGIDSLAKTTEIYLKDARFNGYSSNLVIKEMFERGVFSFIPAVLLEMYDSERYKLLPISSQTHLIQEMKITPYQIEKIASFTEKTLEKSKKIVKTIFDKTEFSKENILAILKNISSGNASSRIEECLCLNIAAGIHCPYADRDNCIGCGYEIYTKATMHLLMKEYIRLNLLKRSTQNSIDNKRYTILLEKDVMPAIYEMINALKILYSDEEFSILLDEVEEGVSYVSRSI